MTRVLQYGFGSIGRWVSEIILGRENLELVGVIDNDNSLIGKDVGKVLGIGRIGIRIDKLENLLPCIDANIVLHSTVTAMDMFFEQVKPCIELGMSIVTSSEDVIYPWKTQPLLASELDTLAKKYNVAILATGVNPGFTTDLLPLILSGASDRVDQIYVRRVVDFSEYPWFKPPYMGFGMSPSDFKRKVSGGVWRIGRNPLPGRIQNLHLIADTLGWVMDETSVIYEPIVSLSRRETPWGFSIDRGMVAGVKQIGIGKVRGEEKIRLESIAICHPRPDEDGFEAGNTIIIEGEPSHRLILKGGTVERGGYVTSARMVNYIPIVLSSSPGLKTMVDLPAILNRMPASQPT